MILVSSVVDLGLAVFQKTVLIPLRPLLREIIHEEASHYLMDIEWRYSQARELLNAVGISDSGTPQRKLTAEDMNDLTHRLTGYVVSNNTNAAGGVAAGSIRWQALHIVFAGVDYVVADGASLLTYTTFIKPGSGTAATLVSSNTKPTLTSNDILVFVNNAGICIVAGSSSSQSMPVAVANNAVDTGGIQDGAVGSTELATAVNTSITTAQTTANTGVTNAATALTQGNLGITNAGLAQTQANLGVTNAATAQTQATLGVTNAATAQTQATLGVTNAATADGKAVTADGKAVTATTNAATAQTQANLGVTNAATAQTRGDLGVTNAAVADGKAVTATTNAATAQTQANLGVTNAATAQTQANLGVTNAATAQTQATLGVTNAATAQTAATTSVIGPSRLNILSHVFY